MPEAFHSICDAKACLWSMPRILVTRDHCAELEGDNVLCVWGCPWTKRTCCAAAAAAVYNSPQWVVVLLQGGMIKEEEIRLDATRYNISGARDKFQSELADEREARDNSRRAFFVLFHLLRFYPIQALPIDLLLLRGLLPTNDRLLRRNRAR